MRGALAAALAARRRGYERFVVAPENAAEAALAEGVEVLGVDSLSRLADLLHGRWRPDRARPLARREAETAALPDFADVRGQADAKRALEIAAAGGHNVLMVGPPGAGKTMVARRLPGILPPPSFDEALEITRIHGAAGLGDGVLAAERPFRAPHHTISPQGLVGGGSLPRARGDHPRPPRRVVPGRGRGVLPRRPSRRCASRSRTGSPRSPAASAP